MPGYVIVRCRTCGAELHRSLMVWERPVSDLARSARDSGASPWCAVCVRFVKARGLFLVWEEVSEHLLYCPTEDC